MPNQASDVYNYLKRPVHVVDSRRIDVGLRQRFQNIKRVHINDENYYIIPNSDDQEQDMGRSEKIILYSEAAVYSAIENNTTPKPDALLKLPKHGSIKQVQNEAMALGIAECAYGLTTASATMVQFDNKPALFVPFDDMIPLTEVASGESKVNNDGKIVQENSTLNPIGSGLSPNLFIEDFGNAFGLMYLSGDPDAIGSKNQNKGYQGRNLYVFDHAISTSATPPYFDLFNIDSRLSQTPSTIISGRIRHTKGRNFSLIEDASTAEKFDSLSPEKCERVLAYCDQVIAGHSQQQFTRVEDVKQSQSLLEGAREVKQAIQARINRYRRMLPQAQSIDSETVKNALILEKILNKPRLYTDLGRPYRNLTTTKPHKLRVTKVQGHSQNLVSLEFNQKLSLETIIRIQKKLGLTSKNFSNNRQKITVDTHLLNDLEKAFYPETASEIQDGEYISYNDIKNLCVTYNEKPNALDRFIKPYINKMQSARTVQEQIGIMCEWRNKLKKTHYKDTNQGLHKHLTKSFEYAIQQKLQEFLESRLATQFSKDEANALIQVQNQAFATAVKLDFLQEFNSLSIRYATQPDNLQLAEDIRSIFSDFSNVDTENLTMHEASELREDFLLRMQNTLSAVASNSPYIQNQRNMREAVQKLTHRGGFADKTADEEQHNDEHQAPRHSN